MNAIMSNVSSTAASTEIFKKSPAVASITRNGFVSDGLMESIMPDGSTRPVMVGRSGWRGTQNVAQVSQAKKREADDHPEADTVKDYGTRDVSNIGVTDSAFLDPDAKGLRITFGVHFSELSSSPLSFSASNAKAKGADRDPALPGRYRDSFVGFIERAKESEGLQEVARRYARNILNARSCWRNRLYARAIRICVYDALTNALVASADALDLPLYHFNDYTDDERKLGALIANALSGESKQTLRVETDIDFGHNRGTEVYPSQNYITTKPEGLGRTLYYTGEAVDADDQSDPMTIKSIRKLGQAAMRGTKVGNALRTIDTWFPAYETYGKPIAVEPNGANLEAQVFFRDDKNTSAFTLANRMNALDPDSPEGMFMIAILMRGGVLSGAKEESPAKES